MQDVIKIHFKRFQTDENKSPFSKGFPLKKKNELNQMQKLKQDVKTDRKKSEASIKHEGFGQYLQK